MGARGPVVGVGRGEDGRREWLVQERGWERGEKSAVEGMGGVSHPSHNGGYISVGADLQQWPLLMSLF